ncbi:PepSY domain-containing protein [Actinoplanes sp. DH11]|uniref:PepSY domain-containing protein n=1 Tax=Actinoplanes sp. DH11 TaxID=2857011 RepID=UPI001E28E45D|nr:PepSY domain-containing protein [Actinoplanes sp. DH11]
MRHPAMPIAAVALVLALAGCNDPEPGNDDVHGGTNPAPSAASGAVPTESLPSGVTEDQARDIVLQRLGGGEVTGVETVTEQSRTLYRVRATLAGKEYAVDIDTATGEIVTGVDGPIGS